MPRAASARLQQPRRTTIDRLEGRTVAALSGFAYAVRLSGMDPGHHRDGRVLCPRDHELFDGVEWILPQVVTKYSATPEVLMGRVLFAGWSNSRNSMRLGCVYSDEVAAFDQENQDSGAVVQPDAFQLHEFDGDQGIGEGLTKIAGAGSGHSSQLHCLCLAPQYRLIEFLAAWLHSRHPGNRCPCEQICRVRVR